MRSGVLFIVIIGVMVLFSVLVTLLSNDSESTQLSVAVSTDVPVDDPTEAPLPTAVPVPTELPPVVENVESTDITYAAIQAAYQTLSTDDWSIYARSLVNRHIQWQGVLTAIHTTEELWFTPDLSSQTETPQTALHLSQPSPPIKVGDVAIFEGEISRIVVFDGQVLVHINNGQLISTRN
jgi:hypothetical protein